jgi:hypothetical protein
VWRSWQDGVVNVAEQASGVVEVERRKRKKRRLRRGEVED